MKLEHKKILLGLSGSIAAYKAPELIRLLQAQGAEVQVMATPAALQFVTTTTLEAISGFPVHSDVFQSSKPMAHIQSGREADLFLIAPASANTLAKLAHGFAEDIVSATFLASSVPIVIAPAMNTRMWNHPFVQENVEKLRKIATIIEPEEGALACGEYGKGRFPQLEAIVEMVIRAVTPPDLRGKKVLITAGATREFLDPVRFLSNASSGKMALALAREAFYRGAEVTVVKGFTEISFDHLAKIGVQVIEKNSAATMIEQTLKLITQVDVFLCPAAIADYQVIRPALKKIKKEARTFDLQLTPTPDLLQKIAQKVSTLKKRPFIVGFALEDTFNLASARRKLRDKKVDLLLLNTLATLGSDDVQMCLLERDHLQKLSKKSKQSLSETIFNHIVKSI